MNCDCDPPLPVTVRVVQKEGHNKGREFFSCSNCNFFQWADSKRAPPSASSRRSKAKPTSKSNWTKITIDSFEWNTSLVVWLALTTSEYDIVRKELEAFPTESCKFNHRTKFWTFHFSIYEDILKHMKSALGADSNIEGLPRFLESGIRRFIEQINSQQYILDTDGLNLTPSLRNDLLPYQVDCLKFVIKRGGRALIADEMGCGKTVEAISVIQHYRNHLPALLVMPVNLIEQWKSELLKYSHELFKLDDICIVRQPKDHVYGKICIIPYTMIEKMADNGRISTKQFGIVIADESHYIKSYEAKRTLAVLPFLQEATVALCMTGTPAVNRPIELFPQLQALLPKAFSDYNAFGRRYCDAKPGKYGSKEDFKGSSNESELKKVLEGMVMIRRLKQETLLTLPQKEREYRYIEADAKYANELNALQKRSQVLEQKLQDPRVDDGEKRSIKQEKESLLQQYFKVTGLSKIKAVQEELFNQINSARIDYALEMSKQAEEDEKEEEDKRKKKAEEEGIMKLEDDIVILDSKDQSTSRCEETIIIDSDSNEHAPERQSRVNSTTTESPSSNTNEQDLDKVQLLDTDDDERTICFESPERKSKRPRIEADDNLPLGHSKGKKLFKTKDKKDTIFKDNKKKKSNGKTRASSNDLVYFDDESAVEDEDYSDDDEIIDVENAYDVYDDDDDYEEDEEDDDDQKDDDNYTESTDDICVDSFFESVGKAKKQGASEQKSSKVNTIKETKKTKQTKIFSVDAKQVPGRTLSKKILVFAHHHAVLDAIEECLREAKVRFIRVDGRTTSKKKNELISQFQSSGDIDVALLGIKSCGAGLNLTAANIAIFAELHWSPGDVLQAEDRIHRLGQKRQVQIIYLLGKNTADDIVWQQIQRKYNVLGATIGTAGGKDHLGYSSYQPHVPVAITSSNNDGSGSCNNSSSGSNPLRPAEHQTKLDAFIKPTPPPSQVPIDFPDYNNVTYAAYANTAANTNESNNNPVRTTHNKQGGLLAESNITDYSQNDKFAFMSATVNTTLNSSGLSSSHKNAPCVYDLNTQSSTKSSAPAVPAKPFPSSYSQTIPSSSVGATKQMTISDSFKSQQQSVVSANNNDYHCNKQKQLTTAVGQIEVKTVNHFNNGNYNLRESYTTAVTTSTSYDYKAPMTNNKVLTGAANNNIESCPYPPVTQPQIVQYPPSVLNITSSATNLNAKDKIHTQYNTNPPYSSYPPQHTVSYPATAQVITAVSSSTTHLPNNYPPYNNLLQQTPTTSVSNNTSSSINQHYNTSAYPPSSSYPAPGNNPATQYPPAASSLATAPNAFPRAIPQSTYNNNMQSQPAQQSSQQYQSYGSNISSSSSSLPSYYPPYPTTSTTATNTTNIISKPNIVTGYPPMSPHSYHTSNPSYPPPPYNNPTITVTTTIASNNYPPQPPPYHSIPQKAIPSNAYPPVVPASAAIPTMPLPSSQHPAVPATTSTPEITAEMRARMEKSREAALQKLAAKKNMSQQIQSVADPSSQVNNTINEASQSFSFSTARGSTLNVNNPHAVNKANSLF